MAPRNQVRSGTFGAIVDAAIEEEAQAIDGLDFLESPQGPGITLLPVQRFLFKAVCGVPLDKREGIIPVWDDFRENIRFHLTEREYLKFLYEEGRFNYSDWRDLPHLGFNEVMAVVGRRGGKSFWLAALAVEKLRRLLNIKNPHALYGISEGDKIDFTIMAQDDDGAGRLYDKIKQAVNKAEFFRPFLYKKPGTDLMQFITGADRHRRDIVPSIQVNALPCTTRAARGPSSIFLALDEFAHFRSATGANSDEVYESATPATARFVRRDLGEEHLDSLIVTITSPLTKMGKYYELYKEGMEKGKDMDLPLLIFQSSTAEMAGDAIMAKYLRGKFARDPISWQAEFGGRFLESSGALVPPDKLNSAFDVGRANSIGFDPRRIGMTFFWGTDLGLKKDATALAICHWEQDDRGRLLLVYDYIDRMMVGEGEWENSSELEVEAVLDWFENMNQWLPGAFGATDQYAGAMFVQLARQRGINFLDLVHLSEGINSEMGYALQGYLNQGVIRFPDIPKFRHEIATVKATYIGKYRLRVEAPTEKGAHDDMVDAVALAAWKAQKWMLETGAKGFAFSGPQILQSGTCLRAGDLGIDPELSTMSQLRVADRMRASKRYGSNSGIVLSPRMAARRGRF